MNAQDLRNSLFKSLESVWTDKLLFDFTVKIEDETFECHRLVLTMCSDFFAALFRSGMKEVHENIITLHNISPEVFQLILETVYTGANLLTTANYIDVWKASHQLQIQTIIQMCEHFANKNITDETLETLYNVAVCLQAKSVITGLHQFMLENFKAVCSSPTFLQLTFEDLRDLIKSQDLVVSSEDLVMESVIRWVTYDPKVKNERKDGTKESHEDTSTNKRQSINEMLDKIGSRKVYLKKLFKKVRTCLVSPLLLSKVRKMDLLLEDKDSRDIIDYALSYNAKDFRHCQCPSAALTRSCSGYILAGVYAKFNGWIKVRSAIDEIVFASFDCDRLMNIQLVTFDGELCVTGGDESSRSLMFFYSQHKLKNVTRIPSDNVLLVSHGDFIYILNKDDKIIYQINPKKEIPCVNKFTEFPKCTFVTHAMSLQNIILLFCFDKPIEIGFDKTIVYKLAISSKVWTRLDNLEGQARSLINFKNDKHDYILQRNGNLWLVLYSSDTGNVKFKFLAQLWNFEKRLYGALTFQSKLIIFGNKPDADPQEAKKLNKVLHHFKCISYVGTRDDFSSNLVPINWKFLKS